MANRPRSKGKLVSENADDDDLACPGELLEEDEQLRLEVNIDREMFTRYFVLQNTKMFSNFHLGVHVS